jgi:amino acid transporter
MQIVFILVGVIAWLSVFWIGSIALEATGMPRTKARFQVLSAITGTGFTTSEAEAIVNHPRRRKIATWLIFIGNTGVLAFIIVLLVFARVGVRKPSALQIGIVIAAIVVIFLFIKFGIMDGLTSVILRLTRRKRPVAYLTTEEILHQSGGYSVMRLAIGQKDVPTALTTKATGLAERGITILAIERGDTILTFPKDEETLAIGDYLLCYGKTAELTSIAS